MDDTLAVRYIRDMDFVIYTLHKYALWLVGLSLCFALMARLSPAVQGQRLLRQGYLADLVYYFYYPLFLPLLVVTLITQIESLPFLRLRAGELHGLSQLPLAVQVLLALLLADFIGYWLHRMMHTRWLWRFHRIHHSSEQLDWLSYARFHPVDFILYYTPVALLMSFVGFSPEVGLYVGPFILFYSGFLHANVSWTLGPLRTVLSGPVFHRWHHTRQPQGQNKNFAPTFAFYDRLFGTYYFPDGISPEPIGVTPPIADDLVSQLRDPFV